MKVSLSDAMEHSGITGRTTSEDAAVQSLNNFLRSILKMDETFKIAFLTVLDGPCHDQLVLAEKPFIELRNLSNNPLFSGAHTAPGFKAFMMKLFTGFREAGSGPRIPGRVGAGTLKAGATVLLKEVNTEEARQYPARGRRPR